GQCRQPLGMQKQNAALAQSLGFFNGQPVENRQALQHLAPECGLDGVAGKQALALPDAKGPHGKCSRNRGAYLMRVAATRKAGRCGPGVCLKAAMIRPILQGWWQSALSSAGAVPSAS